MELELLTWMKSNNFWKNPSLLLLENTQPLFSLLSSPNSSLSSCYFSTQLCSSTLEIQGLYGFTIILGVYSCFYEVKFEILPPLFLLVSAGHGWEKRWVFIPCFFFFFLFLLFINLYYNNILNFYKSPTSMYTLF